MDYRITDAPDLMERRVINSSQILDNEFPFFQPKILHCEENSFMLYSDLRCDGNLFLSSPFEGSLRESLPNVISFVSLGGGRVHLRGFLESDLHAHRFSISGTQKTQYRVYLKPFDISTYDKKLRRFECTDYNFARLTCDEIPEMERLQALWRDEKTRALYRSFLDESDPFNAIGDSIDLLRSLSGDLPEKTSKDMQLWFDRPLYEVYGTFEGDDLLAFSVVEGNDSFYAIHYRSSIRRNSQSPQEFLDLHLHRMFAEKGVETIDRGYVHGPRKGTKGLITYKQRFGTLEPRLEVRMDNVSVDRDPEKLFLDAFYSKA